MKLARFIVWMCFIFCMSGCQHKLTSEAALASLHMHEVEARIPPFTQVYIIGDMDVQLHTHQKKLPSVRIRASENHLRHIKTYVKNDVLYVVIKRKGKHQRVNGKAYASTPIMLDINAPKLRSFTYRGRGHVEGKHIKASPFNLWIKNPMTTRLSGWIDLRNLTVMGPGSVKVSGVHSRALAVNIQGDSDVVVKGTMNLRSLDVNGSGRLTLSKLKSHELVIRATGNAALKLSGNVNRMDGAFSEKTIFDAKSLIVKEAFVKTNGESVADVTVTGKQHALARDKSDIYWHKKPYMRSGFMARNGSILDMRADSEKAKQPEEVYDH